MPKAEIDYSNTIIYKIACKDLKIKDLYVGYTTNYVQRKYAHKQNCNNSKSVNYSYKLYEVIRNNGGWYNWKMSIVNFFDCKDQYEAREKEQEYFVSLNATLNSIEPMPKPKLVEIKEKSISSSNPTTKQFECNLCDFECSKYSNYIKHIETIKHKNFQNGQKMPKTNKYACKCGISYKHSSGLSRHKKTCIPDDNSNTIIKSNHDTDKDEIIMLLLIML